MSHDIVHIRPEAKYSGGFGFRQVIDFNLVFKTMTNSATSDRAVDAARPETQLVGEPRGQSVFERSQWSQMVKGRETCFPRENYVVGHI
jgi:hypothetical protein